MKWPTTIALVLGFAALPLLADASRGSTSYSQAATLRCLRGSGAVVSRLRRLDSRRTALRDLAQRTSFEARRGRSWVALAFTTGEPQAQLLSEVLTVPRDPYVLRVAQNVLLMYPPKSPGAATAARRCLRIS